MNKKMYRYVLRIKNNGFRDESQSKYDLNYLCSTNDYDIILNEIKNILSLGNIDFYLEVNNIDDI